MLDLRLKSDTQRLSLEVKIIAWIVYSLEVQYELHYLIIKLVQQCYLTVSKLNNLEPLLIILLSLEIEIQVIKECVLDRNCTELRSDNESQNPLELVFITHSSLQGLRPNHSLLIRLDVISYPHCLIRKELAKSTFIVFELELFRSFCQESFLGFKVELRVLCRW